MPQSIYQNKLANTRADYTPGVYEGFTLDFKPIDYSPLERGIAATESRINKATEQQSAVDEALANIEVNLNPKEREWFATYKADIKGQIQNEIDAGNYGGAFRKAIKLANQVKEDSRINGRLEAQAKYKAEIERQRNRLSKGDIDQDSFDWWLKQNEYNYEDKFDAQGNVISGYEQKFTPLYDKLNLPAIALSAFKLITAEKNTTRTSGQTAVTNNTDYTIPIGNTNYAGGTGIGESFDNTTAYERVNLSDIIANIEELISLTPGGFEQVEQAYNVAIDKFETLEKEYDKAFNENPYSDETKKLKQQLDVRRELLFRNAGEIDYKEYFARIVSDNLFAKSLAYDWRTNYTSTGSNYTFGTGKSASASGGYDEDNNNSSEVANETTDGPTVRQKSDSNNLIDAVSTSAKNIVDKFEDKETSSNRK